jgi:hypothetical protein
LQKQDKLERRDHTEKQSMTSNPNPKCKPVTGIANTGQIGTQRERQREDDLQTRWSALLVAIVVFTFP